MIRPARRWAQRDFFRGESRRRTQFEISSFTSSSSCAHIPLALRKRPVSSIAGTCPGNRLEALLRIAAEAVLHRAVEPEQRELVRCR